NAKLILFVSWFAAVTLATSVVNAGPRGHGGHGKQGERFGSVSRRGGHGKHFSSMSPRGAHGGHGKHFSSMSPRGGHGGHGKHFSSMSLRGGHKFSRGTSGTYRNWNGRDWSVGYLGGRNLSGSYWGGGNWDWYPSGGWGIPYALNYGYYSYGYYPWYRYGFGYPFYRGWSPYWSWGIPYIYSYSSFYPYWYYPSYRYVYDDCSISKRRFFLPLTRRLSSPLFEIALCARASRSRCKCAWSWSAPKGVGLRSNIGNYPERCPTLTRNAVYEIRNASATDSRGPVRICNETTS